LLKESDGSFTHSDEKASSIYLDKVNRTLGLESEAFHHPHPLSLFTTAESVAAEAHNAPGGEGDNHKHCDSFQYKNPIALPGYGKGLTD
jgi:hypothetical protein